MNLEEKDPLYIKEERLDDEDDGNEFCVSSNFLEVQIKQEFDSDTPEADCTNCDQDNTTDTLIKEETNYCVDVDNIKKEHIDTNEQWLENYSIVHGSQVKAETTDASTQKNIETCDMMIQVDENELLRSTMYGAEYLLTTLKKYEDIEKLRASYGFSTTKETTSTIHKPPIILRKSNYDILECDFCKMLFCNYIKLTSHIKKQHLKKRSNLKKQTVKEFLNESPSWSVFVDRVKGLVNKSN